MKQRKCPYCNKTVTGHPNKKFCNSKHRYKYHNLHNPRGFGLKKYSIEVEDIENSMHPFDTHSLGQE